MGGGKKESILNILPPHPPSHPSLPLSSPAPQKRLEKERSKRNEALVALRKVQGRPVAVKVGDHVEVGFKV
jgi:hypothetical protein